MKRPPRAPSKPMTAQADLEQWRRLAEEELGAPASSLEFEAADGSRRKSLYTAADVGSLVDLDTIPGAYPFLRGVRASMYAGRPWTLRQYAGFSTARESNSFYRR